MNEAMRWLLDLDTLQWGAENVRFSFERPLPAWGWAGVVGLSVVFALWSYSRMQGAAWARGALAVVRALLLLALVVFIAGPQLVQSDETVERDWVMVLVDRSASMTIEDAPTDAGGRQAREAQLREAIQESWPTWESLAESRNVVWLGFDAGAFDLQTAQDGVVGGSLNLGAPGGQRSNLGVALEQALRRAAARPVSGVVVLSDGRSMDAPTRSAVRTLQADRVPVHVVPLGSAAPVGDLAVRRVDGPGAAFVNDVAPIAVEIERLGAATDVSGRVQLIDEATGLVLDERSLEEVEFDERGVARVTLTHRPSDPGERSWKVVLAPEGPDLIAGNNEARLGIELIDRPLRVLFIDGYPRWEQRYLKNLLIREASITSSNLILSPQRRASQEGDVEIDALPDSPEQWAPFDVVALGDVQPDVFTQAQLEDLREHVSIRGAGLLWIGGPGATPSEWWETPLADLLPFSRQAGAQGVSGEPALAAPAELAEQLGVMRLGAPGEEAWPAELSDAATGWSLLRWRQEIEPSGLKPTTETLAWAVPAGAGPVLIDEAGEHGSAAATPLVMSMRYGAGRILYVATDEIWRWRFGRGELLFERFWLQLVRLLGRESVSRSGVSAQLTAEPGRAVVDQPVRIAIELLEQSLVELGLVSVEVQLERIAAAGEAEGDAAEMSLVLRPEGLTPRVFASTWLPTQAGRWRVTTSEPSLSGLGLEAEIVVSLPDDELRRPETDHGLLAELSEQTGGRVIPVNERSGIASELPNRRLRLVSETSEPLWDTPLALLAVLSLLTLEWVGRRLIRLL
ncbi:MAG: vWA domain-containing protein [Planctomycetota bacterium]|nr:vWA domain-containing protein [Planctomycetota bacterium]